MENRSRVCDIKKKFECLNAKNETTSKQIHKALSPKVDPCVAYAEPLKNHSNRQTAASGKCHIKRSNAFRSDKVVPSGVRANQSTDKPLIADVNPQNSIEFFPKKSDNPFFINGNFVRNSNSSSVRRFLTPSKSEEPVEYAQVIPKKKQVPSQLKDVKIKEESDLNGVHESGSQNQLESRILKSPIAAHGITEVLKTPLPPGPPPKKPPRTFKHVVGQVIASNKLSSNLSANQSKGRLKLALSPDGNVPFPIIKPLPPVRSKTESDLIVKKVGSKLSYNNVPVQVPNVKAKQNADKQESLFCLNSLNCASKSSTKNNVYDVPFEPKSSFFIDLSQSSPTSPNGGQNIYGLLKKPLSTDHIYSEPYTPHLNRKIKTNEGAFILNSYINEQKKSSLDCHVKTNRTSNNLSTPVTEKKLYYMSSPILDPEVKLVPSTSGMAGQENMMTASPGLCQIEQMQSSPIHEHAPPMHEFQKVRSLLRKVYGEINTISGTDSDTDSTASTTDEATSNESVSPEQLTAKRKGYVKKMSSCRRLCSPVRQRAERLFDVLILIGLNIVSEKMPYIKFYYPDCATLPAKIEELCFPDASDWPPTQDYCHTNYTTVLTNATGDRKYAYCRRIVPEGSEVCVPLAYCIVSSHKSNGFYYKVLMDVENHHGLPDNNFKLFIHNLYNCRFPSCGEIINLPSDVSLKRPKDWREEYNDLVRVIKTVTIPTFLKLFAALLLERKVVLVGCNISKLSDCIEGLQTALFPFGWQHTLITILPKSMLELLNAPTPYLIGIIKQPNEELAFNNIDEALIVDLDKGNIIKKVGDESSILPKKLQKCLRSGLKICLSSEENNVLASEVIIRFFIETTGHFRSHIITSPDNGKRHFEKESFVKGVDCHNIQLFLEWFTETSMFEVFINSELERLKKPGIFEERCAEFVEEITRNLHKKGRNINKTVKNFGERFIDWAGTPGYQNKM